MANLADLMNRNFDLRQSIFGVDALGPINLHMIRLARSVGGEYEVSSDMLLLVRLFFSSFFFSAMWSS